MISRNKRVRHHSYFLSIYFTMRNPARIIATGLFALTLQVSAQYRVRIHEPTREDTQRLDQQASNFFNAAKPAVATAAKSTVTVSYRNYRLSYGTAIDSNGHILTKWSEISPAGQQLTITTSDGKKHSALVIGVYKEHDLAILKSSANLTPIALKNDAVPELGEFIALASPNGYARGLGIVSVETRSLLERDKAYLGVEMDFDIEAHKGILLKDVKRGSAAAKAGLKINDVVLAIDEHKIQGAIEMRNLLQRLEPGSEVTVKYLRDGAKQNTQVQLGSRAEISNTQRISADRMAKMQSMGTRLNKVRQNFPQVIQSDMPIHPNDVGAPVVDLDGKVIGIAIARSSRIKTFVIPSKTILELLKTKPAPYSPRLTSRSANQH